MTLKQCIFFKEVEIIHESVMDLQYRPGDVVFLNIKSDKINVFSKDGNRNFSREI